MIEKTLVKRLAQLGQFLLLDGRVFFLSNNSLDNSNFLQYQDTKLGLIPGPMALDYEEFDKVIYAPELEAIQREFIRTSLQKELFSEDDQNTKKNTIKAVNFLVNDLIPVLIDNKKEYDRALGIDVNADISGKDITEQIIKQFTPQTKDLKEVSPAEIEQYKAIFKNKIGRMEVQADIPARSKNTGKRSLLEQILNDGNVYINNQLIFDIKPTDRPSELHMVINNQPHNLNAIQYTRKFNDKYANALMQKSKLEAIDKCSNQIAEMISTANYTAMEKIASLPEYSFENIGWCRKDNAFYVYYKIPKFAMRNPLRTDVYHPFPETRIAVEIYFDSGSLCVGKKCIIDPMVHPFLNNWENQFEKICILSDDTSDKTSWGIVQALSHAINSFTNGLTVKSIKDHGALDENAKYFGRPLVKVWEKSGEMTREQVKANNYLITNEWHILEAQKPKGENNEQ